MRKSWDDYFLDLANLVATRSTCDRLHVGCVIVKDKRILATGYNGSPAGRPHCDDIGHILEDNHCVATIHAEINAIAFAAQYGTPLNGSTIYLTHSPCWPCTKALFSAGIKTIMFKEEYKFDNKLLDLYKFNIITNSYVV